MKRVARKARAGFTLIELMVVILILGLLAAAIGVAVVKVIGGAKNKLDAERLSKFVKNFNLKLEDGRQVKLVKGSDFESKETSRALFVELHKNKVVPLEDMNMLAGVSGTEAGDEDYQDVTNLDETNIIFTSAADGKDLLELMRGKKNVQGVSFTYNSTFINKYPEDGAVIVFSGETQADVYTAALLKAEFATEGTDVLEIPDIDFAGDIYKSIPFELIEAN